MRPDGKQFRLRFRFRFRSKGVQFLQVKVYNGICLHVGLKQLKVCSICGESRRTRGCIEGGFVFIFPNSPRQTTENVFLSLRYRDWAWELFQNMEKHCKV